MKILIIGGNRFFGKKLTQLLINENHNVTLLNRGKLDDGLGEKAKRIQCDRTNYDEMKAKLSGTSWDIVFDQVCFTYKDAKQICDILNGKVGKYIFASTVSVYNYGKDITEDKFQPEEHSFAKEIVNHMEDYGEAKRQAEVAFCQFADFPVTLVRIPIVVGKDDYTERFYFHIKKICNKEAMYFSNINAQMSFITSDDAAKALFYLSQQKFTGPINVASPAPLSLNKFIKILEVKCDKKAVLAKQKQEGTQSPYGIEKDWFIKTDLLHSLGLQLVDIEKWLVDLAL